MDDMMEKIKFKKYPAYKDSGVEWLGEIPEHWELTRLGTKFEERRTKVSDKDFLPLSVTKQGILPQLDNAAKTNDGENRKLVRAGDFVINSRSDRKGSSGISDRDGSVSLINIVIEPKNIDSTYCNYMFKSYNFIEEFYRMGHGIVADLWTTRYDEMKAIMVDIPPIPEQTAIANFLDRKTALIDQAIDIKQKQIELLKERRQILIHNAVTRGLNPDVKMKDSGVMCIGEIPCHWGIADLRRFTKEHRQGYYSENGYDEFGHRVVRITDLLDDNIIDISDSPYYSIDVESRNRYELKKGDFLFQRTGSHKKIGIFNSDEPSIYASYLIRFRFNERINHEFLLCFFNSQAYTGQLNEQIHGGVNPNVHAENIKICKVVCPPFEEQLVISKYIKSLSNKIATAISLKQQEIEKLKEYKSTLINSAVTGKIKVS